MTLPTASSKLPALATTVAGQGLYFLLGKSWALFVAGITEEALTRLDEALGLLRDCIAKHPEVA